MGKGFLVVIQINNQYLQNRLQDLQELFNRIDTDSSDNVSLKEVVFFFKAISNDLSDESIENVFNRLDIIMDKKIDFETFKVSICIGGFSNKSNLVQT